LSLNPDLVEAHVAQGFMKWLFDWNWSEAEAALQYAISLDPDNPDALGQYASYLNLVGRSDECFHLLDRVEELEPFWIGPKVYRGVFQYLARRFEDAETTLLAAQKLEPGIVVAPLYLGEVYRATGRYEAAAAAYRRSEELMGRFPFLLDRLGVLYGAMGETEKARRILDELDSLSASRHVQRVLSADVYLGLGDHDGALDLLECSVEEREPMLALLKSDPIYDSIRPNLRFKRLLERIGLCEATPDIPRA